MFAFWNQLDDMLNPIMVKEVRQSLRSRAVAGLVLLTLTVLLGATYFFGMLDRDTGTGERFFNLISGIFIFGNVFLAFAFAVRFNKERQLEDLDLTYITTLGAWRIVWGKFLSAAVTCVLLFFICLPFMLISYYMRGISLSRILSSAGNSFVISLTYSAVIMFLGAPAIKRGFLLGLGAIFIVFLPMSFGSAMLFAETSRSTAIIYTINIWLIFLFLLLSASIISDCNSNRTLLLKTFLTLSIPLLPAIIFLISDGGSAKELLTAIYWCSIMTGMFTAVIAALERTYPSRRTLRDMPDNLFLYWLKRMLSNSAVSGLLLAAAMLVFGICGIWCMEAAKSSSQSTCTALGCVTFFYCVLTVFIKDAGKNNRFISKTGNIAILLSIFILLGLLPLLFHSLLNVNDNAAMKAPSYLMLTSHATVFFNEQLGLKYGVICAILSALLLTPLAVKYFSIKNSKES